jgi:hypothetical protein
MAIVTRTFHYHENGNHDETWYRLARDTETGDLFVEHAWARGADVGEERIELRRFLETNRSTARDKLMKLIGTLVEGAADPAKA